ncbi:Uncharacterized conserved protein YbjT, contains NAD(P)-binding and DUF2867 domains [Nakamurella panacisegetis]|uniref:Uncharacterized conserved protein YbjT, contains NAD(P)-binding and DUF2867 domains n=1 Tax=Nakamurella panacisegetis TaxID=1090615 RepID=A0A1H0KB81_9ACTN|nr:3-beta hydroxysteroid dehydrogenase [Nakamurella panacisegetis]SDO53188.1 Uncharacterized conserved protein YbjT, contains NAD(P)-binding and DUF2867 domains [Nakamurella panacisegetis]
MRVAVAGGTGLLGRKVVGALQDAGHGSVVLARSAGVDITTGQGLDEALAGVDTLIDVSNVTTIGRAKSVRFFTSASRHLLDSGRRAGVRHHVALSIVGVDRVDFGYYQGKRAQEELVLGSGAPVSVLRATQFHEFAGQFLDRGRGPALVPRMRSQPIAAAEVAQALVELAAGEPVGRTPDLAGPRVEDMIAMVRAVNAHRGRPRFILPIRFPGRAGTAMAGDGLLPLQDGPRGRQTFTQWLGEQFPVGSGR